TGDLIHVDQALLFFLNQIFECFVDLHLALFGALAEEVGQHVLEIDVHLLDALVGNDFKGRKISFADVDFYRAVVKFAFTQLLAKFFAGAALRFVAWRRRCRTFDYQATRGSLGWARAYWREENV